MIKDLWRKARGFGQFGGVQAAQLATRDGMRIAIRDGKMMGKSPVIYYTPDEWAAFLREVRTGSLFDFEVLV